MGNSEGVLTLFAHAANEPHDRSKLRESSLYGKLLGCEPTSRSYNHVKSEDQGGCENRDKAAVEFIGISSSHLFAFRIVRSFWARH